MTSLGLPLQAFPKHFQGFHAILYFFTLLISLIKKGCLLTSYFNGGSCLPDKQKQTFSYSCLLLWTEDRCEIKLGKNELRRNEQKRIRCVTISIN